MAKDLQAHTPGGAAPLRWYGGGAPYIKHDRDHDAPYQAVFAAPIDMPNDASPQRKACAYIDPAISMLVTRCDAENENPLSRAREKGFSRAERGAG
jgi:hypothetical protein